MQQRSMIRIACNGKLELLLASRMGVEYCDRMSVCVCTFGFVDNFMFFHLHNGAYGHNTGTVDGPGMNS